MTHIHEQHNLYLFFCVLTIRKHLLKMRFERSGRGQEPSRGHKFSILENFLSIRDFTSQTLASFPSDLVGVALVGATPLHLACARPFGRLKAPLGLSLLRCAAQTRACRVAGGTGSHPRQRKTERSRWGTPCCTYRYRMWILAGCVFRGAPCFCFAFNFLTHGFRPPACMICYRLVAGSVIFRFLPMQAWQGSHRGGWW